MSDDKEKGIKDEDLDSVAGGKGPNRDVIVGHGTGTTPPPHSPAPPPITPGPHATPLD